MEKTLFTALSILPIFALSLRAASLDEQPQEVRRIKLADILVSSAKATADAYPDADDVMLDSVRYEAYNPDGTSVAYDDTYTKVLTEKGKRGAATTAIGFNVVYGTNEVIAADVIKPDGKVVPVDLERNSSIMIDPSSMGSNIYDPNDKIRRVAFPDIEIGDVIHFAYKETQYKVRVPDMWSDYQVFEDTSPFLRYSYMVSSPASRPIRHACLRAGIPGTVTNYTVKLSAPASRGFGVSPSLAEPASRGCGVPPSFVPTAEPRTLLVWDVADVPQAFPERSMPAFYTVAQRLLLSTADDWPSLSRWYWNLCKPRLESTTPEMLKLVKSLKASAEAGDSTSLAGSAPAASPPDGNGTVRAIFTWVSQNIRYMGVTTETEAPGYEPHDVSMTFTNRYGVCRDKAALLVAMLRAADIDAYPVLIHVGEKRDAEVPMTFFNHAIVGVRNGDGSYTLMDPTNESAHDLLPAYLDDKSFLVAHPDGEPLRVSPITPASANMLRVESTGTVDKDGTLSLDSEIKFEGINDSIYRGAFARMPATKRRDFFDGLVKRRVSGAVLKGFSITPENLQDTDVPLSVKLSLSARDFLVAGDTAALVDPPWFSSSIGYVNFLLDNTGLEKRRYPLVTETACGVEEHTVLSLEGVSAPLAIPSDISFSTNGVTFARTASYPSLPLGGAGSPRPLSSLPLRGAGSPRPLSSLPLGGAGSPRPLSLSLTRRFELNLTEFPPELYLGLKDALKEIEHADDERAVFSRGDPAAASADFRVLSRDVTYDLVSPSCWTTTAVSVKQILTYAGKKKNAEVTIAYNPAWEQLDLLYATVSNLTGEVKSVQPHEINIMDQGWVASAPRYPAGKTMVVSLPGVETGSVVSVAYRVINRDAPFFYMSSTLQGTDPTDAASVTVTYPSGIKLETRTFGKDIAVESSEEGGRCRVTYSTTHPKTLPREDFTADTYIDTASVYASVGNWNDYKAAVAKVVEAAVSPAQSAKARLRATELCAKATSPAEKTKAVRDFVVRNIRTAGPSFIAIPLAASPADTTLADGYGNAFDKAVLLYAMLDEAGLKPGFVLSASSERATGYRAEEDPRYSLPFASVYSRPLVFVGIQKEDSPGVFLNDTDQYAELGATPSRGNCLLDIPVGPERGAFPDKVTGLEDKLVASKIIDLDASGNASITCSTEVYGAAAAGIRRSYTEMTPEHLSRHHQELVGSLSVAATADGPMRISVTNYPVSFGFSAKAPRYAAISGDMLTLMLSKPSQLISFRSDTRELPFEFSGCNLQESKTTVILPAETEEIVMKPENIDFMLPGGYAITRHCEVFKRDDGRLVLELTDRRAERPAIVFEPLYYSLFTEMNRRISHPGQATVVVRLRSPFRGVPSSRF